MRSRRSKPERFAHCSGAKSCTPASWLHNRYASHLLPLQEGLLIATGKVVHRGRSTGYTECEIVDAQGRTVAKLTSTCMVTRLA
ncbi:MAG: PaaI family thioesterase [Thermoanaerobaculia bacterium]